MNFINGNKIGTRVNVSINGILHSKDCGTDEGAKEFFTHVLEAKSDPTDKNVNILYGYFSKNIRIAREGGFETDNETGEAFLKGFNTPVPTEIFETIEDYIENSFPIDSIKNFWILLMANPDKSVREDLFKFIQTHDFSLTDKGYMIVYKTVDLKHKVDRDLAEFVSEGYLKVKSKWKKSPANFYVYEEETITSTMVEEEVEITEGHYEDEYGDETDMDGYEDEVTGDWIEYDYVDGEYDTEMVERSTSTFQYRLSEGKKPTSKSDNVKITLFKTLDKMQAELNLIAKENKSVYTDKYTHSMKITLGTPVKQKRMECDGDSKNECSNGLHVGATKYVEKFRGAFRRNSDENESPVLVCLVNPMNVIAVPEYDNSKMRVCEYYPFAKGTVNAEGNIEIIESSYFEDDYVSHEGKELTKLLKANEDNVRQTAKNTSTDDRPYDEYMDILEARVVELAGV